MPNVDATTQAAASTEGASKPLLKTRDVADQLAMSREQVWKLWSCGELAGYKLDRHVRFAQSDVDAFLAQAYTGERETRRASASSSRSNADGPYRRI